MEASFHRPNLLPLEWFAGGAIKTEDADLLRFPFVCTDALTGVKLYIPKTEIVTSVTLDGAVITGCDGMVYDDAYTVYALTDLAPGNHEIAIGKTGPFRYYDRIFLEGEFDVAIGGSTEPYKVVLNLYNIKVSVPEKAEVTLSRRTTKLSTQKSWAEQGQIFYSGETDYACSVELPEDGEYRLTMPRVRDVVDLCLDDTCLGRITRPPYSFSFTATKGAHKLTLRVVNSLGNQMECYAEESGLLCGGIIEKI